VSNMHSTTRDNIERNIESNICMYDFLELKEMFMEDRFMDNIKYIDHWTQTFMKLKTIS